MLSDQELQEFQTIVGRWYPTARRGFLLYEAEEGRRAVEAITEIRDALDHFWRAGNENDPAEVRRHFRMIEDHLRSAGVEPIERAVEERLYRARFVWENSGGLRRIIWYAVFLSPPTANQVQSLEIEARYHLREGRLKKADPRTAAEAIDHFVNAHDKVKEMEALFYGPQISERKYQLILATLTLVFGYALGKLF